MRFLWPAFIPSEQISPFFKPVRATILKELTLMPVAESISGALVLPIMVWHVPERFHDRNGKPLTLWTDTKDVYLSPKYPGHVLSQLYDILVADLDDEQFLDHLDEMISGDQSRFQAQPEDWHSDLARALIPLADDEDLKSKVRGLPIIPLMNGKWDTASSGPGIFPDDSDLGDLLVLHSVRIIQPAVTTDANRRHLWASLGIENISRQDVCRYIVNAHAHPASHPKIVGWTRAQLVAHARFLFLSNWRPTKPLDIWVESTDGRQDRSSGAYLFETSHEDEAVARVIRRLREDETLFILHKDYSALQASGDGSNLTVPELAESGVASDNDTDCSVEDWMSKRPDLYLNEVDSYLTGRSSDLVLEFTRWRRLRSDWDASLWNAMGLSEASSPHGHDKWTSYLGEVLQVARLPRLAVTSTDHQGFGEYRMSEDFRLIFSICDVSDVIHLLVSNWPHYSKFLEISDTQDRDRDQELQDIRDAIWPSTEEEFPDGHAFDITRQNLSLIWDLRYTMVRTSTGMTPLYRSVLAGIDPRFEDDAAIHLPTLKLAEYSAEAKARLSVLLVSVEDDASYYIKCLRGMLRSDTSPSYEQVSQVYAEIQKRYETDTREIR